MKKRLLWKKVDTPSLFNNKMMEEIEEAMPPFTMEPNYDLYSLQTNFKLTVDILKYLSQIDGIESISPVSQYQVIVGLPNSGFFDHNKIKETINNTLQLIDDEIDIIYS